VTLARKRASKKLRELGYNKLADSLDMDIINDPYDYENSYSSKSERDKMYDACGEEYEGQRDGVSKMGM
jgi:hypothetical protein